MLLDLSPALTSQMLGNAPRFHGSLCHVLPHFGRGSVRPDSWMPVVGGSLGDHRASRTKAVLWCQCLGLEALLRGVLRKEVALAWLRAVWDSLNFLPFTKVCPDLAT